MAKKKKLAANPARGFATTSIASKPKVEKQPIDSSATAPPAAHVKADDKYALEGKTTASASNANGTPANGASDRVGDGKDKELSELTPEELEARLEEADLQAFVDKYSARSARDASRHVAKLQTERRLLRKQGQSHKLFVRGLLGDELIDQIMRLARDEVNDGSSTAADLGTNTGKRKEEPSEDEALVMLWTLHRALLSLGFDEVRVLEALDYALKHLTHEANNAASLWAFEECLDWLTLNLEEHELPDFDLHGGKVAKSHLEAGTETPSVSSEQSDADDSEPMRNLPEAGNQQLNEYAKPSEEVAPTQVEENVSDLESDLEPEELLASYLETKARLYETQPDLMEIKALKGKPAKNQSAPNINPKTPKAKKLMAKLQKIESDMLFDSQAANEKWTIKRNQIAQEVAERKKLGLSDAPDSLNSSKTNYERQSPQNQSTPASTEGSDPEDDSDDDLAFGDLFASIPSNSNDPAANQGNEGDDVTIRDFGKSSGISPRRILEEACRARDSRSQLVYKVISRAAFSNRQSLTVKWSKEQNVSFPIEFKSVASTFNSDSCTFSMSTVATPDSRQSESYVSVVALFQIFSTSSKEEKVYLRLPAIWRDLWFELTAQRKRDMERTDREAVRQLREIYRTTMDGQRSGHEHTQENDRDNKDQSKEQSLSDRARRTKDDFQGLNEQTIKEIWQSKISAPSYQSMLPGRSNLPIFQFREAALSAIEEHKVTIICGETGCGKSTQMPAFILERAMQQGMNCKIYCTEPRRISAITLAQRVSQELGESKSDLGTARSLVGYAIRLESHVSASTRLVYATTGIVLRMLESKDGLKDVTHVVIDEVHERSIETDFLLIILRSLIIKRPDLRIILMSATVDADRFSKYFNGAPILNVPGRTFPVETKFLEDAIELTGHVIDDNNNHGGYDDDENEEESLNTKKTEDTERLSQYSQTTGQTLKSMNEYRIDFALIVSLITKVCSDPEYQPYSKAILVFLPGIGEIRQLSDMIHGTPLSRACVIHSLHSAIPSEDQQRAFQPPPRGMKKIVISTNIAETGVTIPDVTCVIDTGKHKEMRFDERRQISRLIESFISRANAKQRRGRAGRVQAGLCFHLFTRTRHEQSMAEEQTPEMLRLSLQDLIMRVKICKLGDIQTTLASALDPPSAKNIRRAIDALIEVGALTTKEDLTTLGQQLSKLPLDPYLGKLVLHGVIFGSLDIALTIAATLTSKSPFVTPINGRQQALTARSAFSKGDSDLLTDFNAYASWRRVCMNSPTSEFSFCRKNLLSSQTLANIEDLKAQLLSSLTETGLIHNSSDRSSAPRISNSGARTRRFTTIPDAHTTHAENLDLASALIASSFYPKLLTRDGKGWRNVATNQPVSLHPTSVLRTVALPPTVKFLSFYSILQASSGLRNYNATSLTPVAPLLLALLTGDAGFHPVAHVLSLDGARVRFLVDDDSAGACWKAFVALKFLRRRLEAFVSLRFGVRAAAARGKRDIAGEVERRLGGWMQIWEEVLERSAGK